jgi:C4-dicarboxylate-specific signal transduction histidine kinase
MSALGEMASGIAHEINNPLAVIVSRAGLLMDQADHGKLDIDKVRHAAKVIESTCQRIAKTVRALRAFARDDEYEPLEIVKVQMVIDDTLDLCREKFKSGVTLEVGAIDPTLMIKCHPVQISQVLLNLLSNAYDAALDSPNPCVKVECVSIGSEIEFSVSDSGKGIPPELRARVLEPFFTTKPVGKGTGLGLSISQRIIHAHGGEIFLSPENAPTRISFNLEKIVG